MVARSSFLSSTAVFRFMVTGCADELRVTRFSGQEAVSGLFEFHLELASMSPSLDFDSIVGKPALLTVLGDKGPRSVHGLVCRFEQVQALPRFTLYRATLVPQVWRLRHRQNCRIFQGMTTPDILKKVLATAGIAADQYRVALSGSYEPRDYCVQYRESDWAFMSRLMEEDGIFYFFEHSPDGHVLVMGDAASAFKAIPAEQIPFRHSTGMVTDGDHVERFRFTEEVQPGQVALRDFNFKRPNMSMEVKGTGAKDTDLEVYDYPGEYQLPGRGSPGKGATLAQVRMEEWQALRVEGHGESDCERFVPGGLFTLAGHARKLFNRRYLLTGVAHEGYQPQVLEEESGSEGQLSYSNHFSCLPEDVPYRPARVSPKPVVRGIQTAIVVGPSGEEIYTDEFGRVKVQFHWDREGKSNEKSSCWVRVSQPWGGEAWGGMFIPRIGQEVVVDFIEGDPDRPLITGRVYNGVNPTPYPLPDEKTKSTLRTNTSPGGEGFNELRFEDKKGAEQVFIHSQRNMDVHVKNDSMENILHDRHQTIGGEGKAGKVGDQNELVFRDKNLKVHRHSQEHIGGDLKLLVGGIDGPGNQDVHIQASRKEKVDADSHLSVGGKRNEQVGDTWSITVGKDLQIKVSSNHALEAGKEIHLSAPTVVIEASQGLTLKVGGNFITLNPASISVMGTVVNLNSGGAPLSGSGVNAAAPEAPADAQPTAPTPADSGRQ
ncbi:type VI secretion system Vgr family protein [Pyxidicoccus xibeiensis]|uniref:type VI secretion system Vgr family protein n=1 Tax=Pyxidicoccus xibeiensis TaxID=2906759 RepID=UPI0020A79020|nr:type VI secretion system tip protein VgrG [Pyxidicoccus xibeiensis]MCP3140663.1 type VI secretion system tip protein VgrG [Pyxidicoccus xibeiensis]